jgi:hypothetical protein
MEKTVQRVVVYPAPQGAALSAQYTVRVNGQDVDVYAAPVWSPPYGKPFGGPYAFAYFDFAGEVEVEVRSERPLDAVRILPESRGVTPRRKGGALVFTLASPCQLSIEPDAKNGPLLLFANPIEAYRPQPGDPNVVYFGPGLHRPGEIVLGDDQTLYIAGGAVVKGGVRARGKNIRIAGRGIIDGLDWERFHGPTDNPVCLTRCDNATVEGIIVKDGWGWTFVLRGCRGVQVDNVKICSARCENNDGIGIVNSQRVRVANCFVRTDDDCITTKGFGWPDCDSARDGWAVEDVVVSHCTLWTDRAHIWRLGCESWTEGMRRLVFRDIDVLHADGAWMVGIQPAEEVLMEDVLFEDVRVNGEGQEQLIGIYPGPTEWVRRRNTPGRIRNITFKDFIVTGSSPGDTGLIRVLGCDAKHTVEGIIFESVVRYGKRATQDSPGVEILEHAHGAAFR